MNKKEQKGGFLSMLLGTLGAILLGNLLNRKGAIATSQGQGICRAGKGKGINRAEEGIVRAGYGNNKMDFQFHLILLTLTCKNIIKMNPDLMAFIREIIYPK